MSAITFLSVAVILGCESGLDLNNSSPSTAVELKNKVAKKGQFVSNNGMVITENDLGPSDRPAGFPDSHTVPEEDWYTPTHGSDPLNTPSATYGFVADPDHKDTYGNGSFLFDVPAGERSWILTDQYGSGEWHGDPDAKQGTKLEDITALSYSTYITPGSAVLVPAMQIMAEDGSGNYLGLVFDPPSSEAQTGEWQTWNALSNDHAGWRLAWDQGPEAYSTWNELVTDQYPDAKILWSVGVAAGTWPNKDFKGYTDLLTVGVNGEKDIFDFEPLPATRAQCKKSGWKAYGFKNQGQCIQFVNTGKDSR